jgi:hypothetical protein
MEFIRIDPVCALIPLGLFPKEAKSFRKFIDAYRLKKLYPCLLDRNHDQPRIATRQVNELLPWMLS